MNHKNDIAFRTVLAFHNELVAFTYPDKILGVGSCFAENISERLTALKFEVLANPFGILYNPVSIGQMFDRLLSGENYSRKDIFEYNGLWHSFDHHGRFSAPGPGACLEKINEKFYQATEYLKTAKHLLLTLGTAHVFEWQETGKVVANCHKLPGEQFARKRLDTGTCYKVLSDVLLKIKKQNPQLQVICTVSPIRHIRDGLVENQRSKASLILALDRLCQALDFVQYAPVYEMMMDDLRDYRFYEADLIHPNKLAIDYIWSCFTENFFSPATKIIAREVNGLVRASLHKPIHPEGIEYQKFIKAQLVKIHKLEQTCPFLDFSEELARYGEPRVEIKKRNQ